MQRISGVFRYLSTHSSLLKWGGRAAAGMWTDAKAEVGEASGSRASIRRRAWNSLLLCAGDMGYLDKYMQGRKSLTMHNVVFSQTYFLLLILEVKKMCDILSDLYRMCSD